MNLQELNLCINYTSELNEGAGVPQTAFASYFGSHCTQIGFAGKQLPEFPSEELAGLGEASILETAQVGDSGGAPAGQAFPSCAVQGGLLNLLARLTLLFVTLSPLVENSSFTWLLFDFFLL